MKRRVLKTLKWVAIVFGALLLLIVGTLILMFTSEGALSLVWSNAKGHLPEGIAIESVDGRLIGPLQVRGLEVNNEAMQLSLESAELRWRANKLFSGVVYIDAIALKGLEYTALATAEEEPEPEPGEPFELPDAIDLPIDVVLDGFTLDRAEIRTAAEAEPFVINKAKLVAALVGDDWQVTELSADGPLFEIDGGVKLTPGGRYANQLRLDWRVNPPDMAPAVGKTRLSGDLDNLQLTQSVEPPYNLQAEASVRQPLEALRIDAQVKLTETRLRAIGEDLPEVTLTTLAKAKGSLEDLGFTLDARASDPTQGTAMVDLAGSFTGALVKIEKLNLTSPDTPGRLNAQGQIALAEGNAMDLELSWRQLQWPLAGAPEYASPQGDFSLKGPLDDYRLQGGLVWSLAAQEQEGELKLGGQGDLQSFVLETLALTGAPGNLDGSANIVWAPALNVTARIDGSNLNPGAFAPEWPGDFDLRLEARAEQKNDGLYARVETLTADGTLREQPLQLDMVADYSPAAAIIERLRLLAGETRLSASGQVTEPMNVAFELDSDDLGTTVPQAQGSIRAEGTARGAYLQPEVIAELEASDLALDGNKIGRVTLDADVDWSAGRESRLTLNAADGEFGTIGLNDLTLTANGRPLQHKLDLLVDSSEGQVRVGLAGALDQAQGLWQFTLNKARLAYQQLDPWELAAPASGRVSAASQSLQQACFASGDARLCLQGENDAQGSQARFNLDELAFAYLQPFIPENLDINGAVSAQGNASLPAGADPKVDLQVRTTDTSVKLKQPEGEVIEVLDFQPGTIDVNITDGGAMNARVDLPMAQGGIKLSANVPGGESELTSRPLDGRLQVRLDSFDFVPKLSPEVVRFDGEVDGDMSFAGTLAAPEINGRLAVKAPLLALATPGLEIRDFNLAVVGSGRDVGIELRAMSGGGNLAADGQIALTDTGPTVNLDIDGEAFQVLNNRDASVYVSPALKIAVTDTRIDVNGQVTVPFADITPQDLPAAGGVTVSDDQVIVRGETEGLDEAEVGGRSLHARVRVIVGDPNLRVTDAVEAGRNYRDKVRRLPGRNVKFEGFGMRAVLAGNLLVVQEPNQPTTGTGQLRIVLGQYKAYGQDLNIQDGQVLFGGGPVSQPALDVRAVRRPEEDILVGVRIRGRVDEPRFTLFSEPAGLTQSEQLSWLVLGRPLEGASSAETSLVTKAALALGVRGGNKVTDRVRDKLGVDELGIENEGGGGAEGAALVVGKYLTPKLYVSYGVGLFEPVNTLRLRYTLSKLWRLETESSGTATGGDVIYSIERGD